MAFGPVKFVNDKTNELKKKVGDEKVIVATSGGVDSMACAILAHKAIRENLIVLYLDNGLMREGEGEEVSSYFSKLGVELQTWDVKERFFEALKGKTDPEEKRIAFRDVFYRTLRQAIKSYSAAYLIQGTIATDIVETQKGIKTQHNVLSQIGINPANYGLKILEPLKELYKPQVQQVAKHLGLPMKVYERKPFPGPALATRIIGEVVPERVEKIRIATKILDDTIKERKAFQVLAVLFSDKATGMIDGKRVYGDVIAIRAVESKDAITAKPYKLSWTRLEKIRDRILTEVPGVVKVLYDITPKPPSTIEYI